MAAVRSGLLRTASRMNKNLVLGMRTGMLDKNLVLGMRAGMLNENLVVLRMGIMIR